MKPPSCRAPLISSLRHVLAWLPLVALLANVLPAQQPEPAPNGPSKAPLNDPAVRTFLEVDLSRPMPTLRAVDALLSMGFAEQASTMLGKAIAGWDPPTQLSAVEAWGASRLVQLGRDPALSASARVQISQLLQSARRSTQQPAYFAALVDAWLATRAAPELVVRQRTRRAGAEIVPFVFQAYSRRPETLDPCLRLLRALGNRAEPPLLAALRASESALVELAARALDHLDTPESLYAMFALMASDSSSRAVRELAAESVRRRLGEVPDQDTVVAQMASAAHTAWRQSLELEQLPGAGRQVLLWRWDPESQNVVAQSVLAEIRAAWSAGFRFGQLRQIAPLGEPDRTLDLVINLYLDKQLNGWRNPLPDGPGSALEWSAQWGAAQLDDALRRTLDQKSVIASLALTEVLALRIQNGPAAQPAELRGALLAAMRHPDRRIRFRALDSVLRLQTPEGYPGVSRVVRGLRWFASSRGPDRVLILSRRREQAQELAATCRSLGFEADQTASSLTALEWLHGGQSKPATDYVLILAVQPLDGEPQEWLQQIRTHPPTAQLPVALIHPGTSIKREVLRAWRDDLVHEVTWPQDAVALRRIIRSLYAVRSRYAGDTAERQAQAEQALRWLAILASEGCRPMMAMVERHPAVVEQPLNDPQLAPHAVQVWAQVGSRFAQSRLADMLLNASDESVLSRGSLVAALAEAMARRGVLLDAATRRRLIDVPGGLPAVLKAHLVPNAVGFGKPSEGRS